MTPSDLSPRSTRHPFCIEVNLESEHNFYTGFTENISSGGLFIATRNLIPLGVRTVIRFSLPDVAKEFEVECEVRWQRLEQAAGTGISPGIGVRFLSLHAEEEAFINRFLKKRDTLFFLDDE